MVNAMYLDGKLKNKEVIYSLMMTEGWKQNQKSQEKLSKEYDVGFEKYCN